MFSWEDYDRNSTVKNEKEEALHFQRGQTTKNKNWSNYRRADVKQEHNR